MNTSPTDGAMFSRDALIRAIGSFVRGESSLEELRRWMTPVVVEPEVPANSEDQLLVARIAMLVEDDSISENQQREAAKILVRALESTLPNDRVLGLMPLFAKVPRLRLVIDKLDSQTITRTSFLSFISESSLPENLRQLLSHKSTADLRRLLDALETGAVEDADSLLRAR